MTILSGRAAAEHTSNRSPPLWRRVRELQRTSWSDDKKAAALVRTQIIEILNDLFWLTLHHAGRDEAKKLFVGTSQRASPLPKHRPPNKAFKEICLDMYDEKKAQGIPARNIPHIIDDELRPYRNTDRGTIARQIRGWVKGPA